MMSCTTGVRLRVRFSIRVRVSLSI